MTTDNLDQNAVQLLRFCNGDTDSGITGWLEWLLPCLDLLQELGLVDRICTVRGVEYITNDAGRQAIQVWFQHK